MAVKFTKSSQVGSLYNPGDIATFSEAVEGQLIKAKVAVAHKIADKAPEPKA